WAPSGSHGIGAWRMVGPRRWATTSAARCRHPGSSTRERRSSRIRAARSASPGWAAATGFPVARAPMHRGRHA
ncbi:MAG: hypothetical protein AVDCRST_MAG73-345, partial [uncultured Thermomicrobiales bacterium]